ncbi:nuclear transport factor 2 family protein [bacterium]|nr:nuclear transport factor 2 family protein [bacterium]
MIHAGRVLPLKAEVENGTLVTHWGSYETEHGRTHYRPISDDRVEVVDFVFKNNAWSPFGQADYVKDADALAIVMKQEEAFNTHDIDAMVANITEDLMWLSVTNDSVIVKAAGRTALRKAMAGYFSAIPSARTEIEEAMVFGSYVAVRERAFWQSKTGERSQFSLAVYHLRETRSIACGIFQPTAKNSKDSSPCCRQIKSFQ